jgi:hypothetical protein
MSEGIMLSEYEKDLIKFAKLAYRIVDNCPLPDLLSQMLARVCRIAYKGDKEEREQLLTVLGLDFNE